MVLQMGCLERTVVEEGSVSACCDTPMDASPERYRTSPSAMAQYQGLPQPATPDQTMLLHIKTLVKQLVTDQRQEAT